MIKKSRSPRVFFGWWTVIASGLLSLWGMGYYNSGMTALFIPVSTELGLSRTTTSIAASVGRFQGGFEAAFTGWVVDKYGPKIMVLIGVFLLGLGLNLMYFVNSLWAFLLVWGVLAGTGLNIGFSLPLEKAVAEWFVKRRGLAMSIRWVFIGLATALVLPMVSYLISTQGWRMTCVIGGLVLWIVGLPLGWFFIRRHRPEYYGLLPDGAAVKDTDRGDMLARGAEYAAEAQEIEFTFRQAVRTPAYWLLILAAAANGMVVPVIMIHAVPFLGDMGFEPVQAALTIASISIIGIPTRFIGGMLADRIDKGRIRFLQSGAHLIQAAGFIAFLLSQTVTSVYVLLVCYYFAFGLSMTLQAIIRARYFGRKAIGFIMGTSRAIMTPVGVGAPIFAGWVYDTTGSYANAFVLLAVLLVVAAVSMALARPPKAPGMAASSV